MHAQRVARKFVNVMDRIEPAPHTPVPAFTVIKRVDIVDPEPNFVRAKRPVGRFWEVYNDLTLKDLVGTGLLGE